MVGYNTDQFYKLPSGVATTSELSPDAYSNPKFLYPGPTRKHADSGHWTDKSGLQRGFMRTLPMTKGDTASEEMKKRRFFFQFNPSSIVRDLSMREDVRNPLLMDPSEFSVPTPGMTSFGFELFLDRTAELNMGVAQKSDEQYEKEFNDKKTKKTEPSPTIDPLLNGSPNEVGVLADIRVLDTIIGAGMTADMMNYIIERGKINSSYATSDSTTTTSYPPSGTDASATGASTTTVSAAPGDSAAGVWDDEAVKKAFEWNVGNQAFLIPTPVRVVFSSLLMVEGYVSGVTIQYPMFNEAMVPMQCSIAIQMQALYIGFAKNETYFTWALANAEEAPAPTYDSPNTVVTAPEFLALRDLGFGPSGALTNFRVAFYRHMEDYAETGPLGTSNYDNQVIVAPSSAWNEDTDDEYLDGDEDDPDNAFPELLATTEVDMRWGWMPPIPEDKTADPIYLEYGKGTGLSITYTWKLTISRKALTDWEKTYSNITEFILAEYEETRTASTAEEWNTFRRVDHARTTNTVIGNVQAPDVRRWAKALYARTSANATNLDSTVWQANNDDWMNDENITIKLSVNGTMSDGAGNSVSFSGSNSETRAGSKQGIQMYCSLSSEGNSVPINPVTGGQFPVVERE